MNYFVLLFLLLNLTYNVKAWLVTIITLEDFLENDCEMLRFGLCINKHSKYSASQLLKSLQCIDSKYPTCQPDTSKLFRSLGKFSETFCSNPVQVCEKVKNKLNCTKGRSCLPGADRATSFAAHDTFIIGMAYARITCISNCTEKVKLNPPSDFMSFQKWFMEMDREKLENMTRSCSRAQNRGCFMEKFFMMLCVNEREKGILWRGFVKDGEKKKFLAGLCDPKSRNSKEFPYDGGPGMSEMYNEGAFHYDLCDRKEPSAVEYARSEALCITQDSRESPDMKQCVLNITGPMPTDESQFIEWFCKRDYIFGQGPDEKGRINRVHAFCRQKKDSLSPVETCHFLVALRQVKCLPVEKRSPLIGIDGMQEARSKIWSPTHYFKCLAFGGEDLVNKCYAQIAKSPPHVDALKDNNLDQAICNSNQHFFPLSLYEDMAKCLKDSGLNDFYLKNCKEIETRYGINTFKSEINCTLPIYGKPAEECFTSITKKKINSFAQLQKWANKTSDSDLGLYLLDKCLENIIRGNRKPGKTCFRSFHLNETFEEARVAFCGNSKDPSKMDKLKKGEISDYFELTCLIAQKNQSRECLKVLPSSSSVDSVSKYIEWFCQIDRSVNLIIHTCKENIDGRRKSDEFWECLKNEKSKLKMS